MLDLTHNQVDPALENLAMGACRDSIDDKFWLAQGSIEDRQPSIAYHLGSDLSMVYAATKSCVPVLRVRELEGDETA